MFTKTERTTQIMQYVLLIVLLYLLLRPKKKKQVEQQATVSYQRQPVQAQSMVPIVQYTSTANSALQRARQYPTAETVSIPQPSIYEQVGGTVGGMIGGTTGQVLGAAAGSIAPTVITKGYDMVSGWFGSDEPDSPPIDTEEQYWNEMIPIDAVDDATVSTSMDGITSEFGGWV